MQAPGQQLIACLGADTWPQALGIQASPAHVAAAVRQRAELVDDIWHAAGDTSSDYNWYTKRGLLAGARSRACTASTHDLRSKISLLLAACMAHRQLSAANRLPIMPPDLQYRSCMPLQLVS